MKDLYMNKKTVLISLAVVVSIVGIILLSRDKKTTDLATPASSSLSNYGVMSSSVLQTASPADKIEVVHFHGTQQCWSCITVGDYALKTIKEKFPEEFESGKIIFKDINGELKENQAIVIKYQARGSSLFVNSILGEKDNIKEDVTVWRLVNSEDQFKTYFENKLKGLLGE